MSTARCSMAWGAGAFALYGASRASGAMWADSSKLTLYALHHYLPSLNPGDHPGWTTLATVWLALTRWIEPVASLHLLSAVTGALAVALAFAVVAVQSGSHERAHTAAALLLVVHPLWWAAAVTETYAPALALALGALLLAASTRGVAGGFGAGVMAGLAVATHAFSAVLLLPFLGSLSRRPLPACTGLLLGLAPVWLAWPLGIPLDPLTGFQAGGGGSWAWHVRSFLSWPGFGLGAIRVAALTVLGLGPLGLVAILTRRRGEPAGPAVPLAGLLTLGGYALLLSVYAPYRVHLMVLFLLAPAIILLAPSRPVVFRLAHGVFQAGMYVGLPWLLTLAGHGDLGQRVVPERSNAWYFLSPVRAGYDGPTRYAAALSDCLPPGSVLLADFNVGAVLRAQQETAGLAPQVRIVPTAVDDALAQADPAAALAETIRRNAAEDHQVFVADRWPPYYRLGELGSRFSIGAEPCGPGARLDVALRLGHETR